MELTKQERAFLHMIRVAEIGPACIAKDPNHGYGVIVGSTPENMNVFSDFGTHPNRLVHIPATATHGALDSTAAGAYQILHRFFVAYQHTMALPDFTPNSQDRIAIQMLQECGARYCLNNDDTAHAVHLARARWASFPESGYGQNQHNMAYLMSVYGDALKEGA